MGITHFDNVTTDTLTATTIVGDSFTADGTTFHPVVVDVTAIDASTNATATTVTCVTIPADSILLNVVGYVTTTFNGDTTQTIEVGITGNTDKYIDPSDLDPAAAPAQLDIQSGTNQDQKGAEYLVADTPILCTWTNTTSATAGAASVYVIYQPLA